MSKYVNLFYLAQGLIRIPENELPDGFFDWDHAKQIEWAQEYWEEEVTDKDIVDGVVLIGPDDAAFLDTVEVGNSNTGEWKAIAETGVWLSDYNKLKEIK